MGVHNHWKVYKDSPLDGFIFLAYHGLLFNCMYEVQFFKSQFPQSKYFGQEYVFHLG